MKEQTVAAGMATIFLNYATRHGANREVLLDNAELTEHELSDQDNRVPMAKYQCLIYSAREMCGDPALHIRYTQDTSFRDISIVGLLVHAAPNMKESMRQFTRYSKLLVEVDLLQEGPRFDIQHIDNGLWIVDQRPDPNNFPEMTEMALGRFIGEYKLGFPDLSLCQKLSFTHARPDYADEAQDLYGLPASYGAGFNGLRMTPEWLEIEYENTNDYAFGLFSDHADELVEALEQNTCIRAQVEANLMKILHEGEISMERTASIMGMSRQTLYRRLKEEKASFTEIYDDLRKRMAEDYLRARKASINQVAYLTGFSEPSSFTRAFRRWTGQSPKQFRDS